MNGRLDLLGGIFHKTNHGPVTDRTLYGNASFADLAVNAAHPFDQHWFRDFIQWNFRAVRRDDRK